MGPEVGDLIPDGIVNQLKQIVEVEPEVVPGHSESSDNCQTQTISSL